MHLCVEGLGSVNVQELGRSVREALHIPESALDAFAFWLCSPLLGKSSFLHFLDSSVLYIFSIECVYRCICLKDAISKV